MIQGFSLTQIWSPGARGYKTIFVLKSAKHEICPANKSQINNKGTAPCPATALISSKCHNSVKNKICSTFVHVVSLYIFARLQENL